MKKRFAFTDDDIRTLIHGLTRENEHCLIYEEYWRDEPFVRGGLGKPVIRGTRIKRCLATDVGAYHVTAVDLKRWSRGRRPSKGGAIGNPANGDAK